EILLDDRIGIEEDHPVACSREAVDTRVPRARNAFFALGHGEIAALELLRELECAISRAVLDNDDFKLIGRVIKFFQMPERIDDALFLIVRRYDERKEKVSGHITNRLSRACRSNTAGRRKNRR